MSAFNTGWVKQLMSTYLHRITSDVSSWSPPAVAPLPRLPSPCPRSCAAVKLVRGAVPGSPDVRGALPGTTILGECIVGSKPPLADPTGGVSTPGIGVAAGEGPM